MKPKNVILVSNKVFHYRVAIYNHLARRLAEQGFRLTVITNELQRDNPYPVEFDLIVEPFSFAAYRTQIAKLDPAVVILFMHIKDFVVWPLLAWLKLRRFKVIYWNHGINLETPNNPVKRVIFNVFHWAADAILLYSRNEERYIAAKQRGKIFVANNTLNFSTFPAIPEQKEAIKAALGVSYDKVLLFVGRVTKSKRLDDLLDAAEYLGDGIGVVIVGGGLSADQRARIDAARNITYLGEIYESEKINRVFKMADVFSIPGKMGLGINQAFYWGLPAVTQDVLHSPEIIYLKEGRNGFIVPRGDLRALAEKATYLVSSDAIQAEFSAAARREIETNASIDTMCDGFLEAIRYVQKGQSVASTTDS